MFPASALIAGRTAVIHPAPAAARLEGTVAVA